MNVSNRWRVANDTICDKGTALTVFGVGLRHGRPAGFDNIVHHGSFLWKGGGCLASPQTEPPVWTLNSRDVETQAGIDYELN